MKAQRCHPAVGRVQRQRGDLTDAPAVQEVTEEGVSRPLGIGAALVADLPVPLWEMGLHQDVILVIVLRVFERHAGVKTEAVLFLDFAIGAAAAPDEHRRRVGTEHMAHLACSVLPRSLPMACGTQCIDSGIDPLPRGPHAHRRRPPPVSARPSTPAA
jgi:hypothetical protein